MRTLPRACTLLLSVALLGGCEKEEAAPARSALLGNWQWKNSFCGWSGASSPATTGHTEVLRLEATGRVEFYRDGTLQYSGHYTLSQHQSMLTKQSADFIRFNNQEYQYDVSGNTLNMAMDVYDGCSSSYERTAQ